MGREVSVHTTIKEGERVGERKRREKKKENRRQDEGGMGCGDNVHQLTMASDPEEGSVRANAAIFSPVATCNNTPPLKHNSHRTGQLV